MTRGQIRKYSEELKQRVVEEIENGKMSMAEARHEYGLNKASLHSWLKEYGRYQPQRDIVEVVMKDEKEKIAQLEKALAEAHLKIRFYDELIGIANKKYRTDLKKSIGTKLSEDLGKKVTT